MKCINHSSADAIAMCCVCGRGLCRSCILDPQGTEMFCSERCRATQSKRDGFRRSVIADYRSHQNSYQWLAIVMLALAVFLFGFTVLPLGAGDTFIAILDVILGGVLLIAAGVLRKLSRRYRRMADELE